jgi:hypothetical protein
MFFLVPGNFLDDRGEGFDAPVTDGLSAHLQYIYIRVESRLRGYAQTVNEGLAHKALSHKLALDMQTLSVAFAYKCHDLLPPLLSYLSVQFKWQK